MTRIQPAVRCWRCWLAALRPRNPAATSTTSASLSSSSSTPSPTPSTSSVEDQAAFAAEEVLQAYFRAIPECLAAPKVQPVTCFDRVATGTELINRRNSLNAAQSMNSTMTGAIEVVSVERGSVDLTSKFAETPPTVPTVVFNVCYDVSNVNIVDKDGKSIVPPDRKPRGLEHVSVYNYKYPDPTQWRVGYIEAVNDKTC